MYYTTIYFGDYMSIVEDLLMWLKLRPKVFPKLFGEIKELTPQQKALIEKWKRGIASALGVPPEAIREDVAERWLEHWIKALVKEEYWGTLGLR
jgi:hypothetical protein